MTVIEEFQTLGQQVDKLQHSANRKVAEEKIRQLLGRMRERNAAFKKDMERLYEAARLVTSQSKTASLGAEVWKEISENLSMALVVLTQIPKPHPSFDHLLDEHKALVRDLIDSAEREYRSYAETAHLLNSPANAKRLREAIEEAKSENLRVYDSADDFLKSLQEK